ncbi:MAG: hypothetical protein R2939_02450 [Kofleriaceae bacterium]
MDALGHAIVVRRPVVEARAEDADVGDADVALLGHDQVGRRQPEVGDAAAVGVADRARRLRDHRQRGAAGQLGAGHRQLGEQPADVEALAQLGGGEGVAAGHAELGEPRDARVLEPTVGARRRRQRRGELRVGDHRREEALDRELPLEAGDAVDLRAEDLAARTSADRLHQVVPAQASRRGVVRHGEKF